MNNKLISIITPVYNSELYVHKCIESVKSQTYSNWEHILIDDCSSDESKSIISQYSEQDSRIKYFRLDKNSGAGIARNKGIEYAKGRFIAFLDVDDRWHNEKLEKQISFMLKNKYSFTYTAYQQVDELSNTIIKQIKVIKTVSYGKALYFNPIGCLTAVYDVSVLGKIYMPTIRKRQDYGLWLKILKKTNAYGLNEVLAFYTVRKGSISSKKIDLIKYQWELFRNHEKLSFFRSFYFVFCNIVFKILR